MIREISMIENIGEALLGVLGIRYIYPKYFSYKVQITIDFWVYIKYK